MKLKSISLVHKAIIYCRLRAATMAPGVQQDETQKAAPEAAGRNDPLEASGIASGGQVGLNMAIEWAGRFGRLALDMERNSRKWRSLAEGYFDALKELLASVQDIRDNPDIPRQALDEKLEYLERRLTEIVKGTWWRSYYAQALQEAQELSKRREEAVQGFIDECEIIYRLSKVRA